MTAKHEEMTADLGEVVSNGARYRIFFEPTRGCTTRFVVEVDRPQITGFLDGKATHHKVAEEVWTPPPPPQS